MTKVMLIRPSSNIPIVPLPLGLMYLVSVLEKKGHDSMILDLRLNPLDAADILKRIEAYSPDIIGIGAMTAEYLGLNSLLNIIKDMKDKPFVAVGGPHANVTREKLFVHTAIDAVCYGEGEETITELASGRRLQKIEGISYRRNGEVVSTPKRPYIEDLDKIPFPAYHRVDLERYFQYHHVHGFTLKNRRHAQMMSSRGCPYGCIFCHNIFGKKFRARSAKHVVDEIRFLTTQYGVKEIHFEDDAFNIYRKRALEIFDLIIERNMGIAISFPNGIRGDLLDEEMVDRMKQAGVYQVSIGVESGDPEIQRMIDKKVDLYKIERAIRMLSDSNIIVDGFFMLGFLNETIDQMNRTIEFASNSSLHIATIHRVNPFPGTKIAEMVKKQRGMELDGEQLGEDGYRFGKVNVSAVDDKTFDALMKKAYWRFYLKPGRLWKLFWLFPNKRTLFRHFLRLLFWR